jgi:acetoin utilization deacetylase AcuC-like enzyme
LKVIFSKRQLEHAADVFIASGAEHPNLEMPERATRLLAAAQASGLELVEPVDYGRDMLGRVHSERYLAFFERIFERWQYIDGASRFVMPNIHPDGRDGGYPKSAAGQAGFHVYDGSCPITAETWDAARWSANSAIHAAHEVLAGSDACYALARPPGHHAGHDLVGGFCYLNNSALAATILREQHERVAILDVDVHHGNGTQDIFYRRSDVLTVSLHAHPERFYPFFWGYENERGADEGEGCNINIPLARGTGDGDYLCKLDGALEDIHAFGAGALVVALGLDAHESDPFQGLRITTAGFARIAAAVARLGLPTVLVQEGGYLSDELGDNLSAFLEGFGRADIG